MAANRLTTVSSHLEAAATVVDVKGLNAVVVGGAGAIGYGCGELLGRLGCNVTVVDVPQCDPESAARKMGGGAVGYGCDITDEAAVVSVFNKIGRVDVLVNAAGITGKTGMNMEDVDVGDWDRVVAVNLKGTMLCMRAVLPGMRARGFGRIVNVASISGKEGNAGMAAYSTSKAAVIALTKVVGKEYAETGVVVNALAPAVVRTPMVAAMPDTQVKYMTDKIPMKRTGEIKEMAAMVAFMCSRCTSFTTGFTWDATGGRATY